MKNIQKNTFYKLPVFDGLELLDAREHTVNFPLHSHDTFNITLVTEQVFTNRINDHLYMSPAGMIVITNPGEVHATICDAAAGTSFFTFYISPDRLQYLNKGNPVWFEDKIINDPGLFYSLMKISQMASFPQPGFEKLLQDALTRLVNENGTNKKISASRNPLFRQFLNEENFSSFSLEKTARKFGLDKFKFLRLFKQHTGLTPNNYIILKRIEKAKTLLLANDDLLGIAIESGFYDSTHFCRHFKKITGVTPMTYRQAFSCNIVL